MLGNRRPHSLPLPWPPGRRPSSSPVWLPSPPTCPQSTGHASRGTERGLQWEVCVWAVLFGWKQRPFWGVRACLLSSRPFWNWVWGEVFTAQGKTIRQLCSPPAHGNPFEPSVSSGERTRQAAQAWQLPTQHYELLHRFPEVWTARHAGRPAGRSPPAVGMCTQGARSGHSVPACRSSLMAPSCLWSPPGAAGSQEVGWADGWVGAGQEQSQRERRKRHFSLGWCSWSRPWPRGSRGPAWLWLRRWVVTEDPGGGGQVGTWQHSQGRPGRAGGSVRAPHTARSSGWASAVLPGCLGRKVGMDQGFR